MVTRARPRHDINMTYHLKLESLGKEVAIAKQPVGKFIKALRALKNIPKHLGNMTEINEQKIIESLPEMITSSYEEIKEVVTIATELTVDEVDQLMTDELIELVAKIIDANEFGKLGDSVKKNFGNIKLPTSKSK